MFTAKIYSTETLAPKTERAIHDGFEKIGHLMGGISLRKTARVKLPTEPNGKVRHERIGFKRFDNFIDFHAIIAPFDLPKDHLGLGYFNTGIVLLNQTTRDDIMATTTAHETAHSAGFVLPNAPQNDKRNGEFHCSDARCMMHHRVQTTENSFSDIFRDTLLGGNLDAMNELLGLGSPIGDLLGTRHSVEDFCSPCKADIRDMADENIMAFRMQRLAEGVTPRPPTGKY